MKDKAYDMRQDDDCDAAHRMRQEKDDTAHRMIQDKDDTAHRMIQDKDDTAHRIMQEENCDSVSDMNLEMNENPLAGTYIRCNLCLVCRILFIALYFYLVYTANEAVIHDYKGFSIINIISYLDIYAPVFNTFLLWLFLLGMKKGHKWLAVVVIVGGLLGMIRYIPNLVLWSDKLSTIYVVCVVGLILTNLLQIVIGILQLLDKKYNGYILSLRQIRKANKTVSKGK